MSFGPRNQSTASVKPCGPAHFSRQKYEPAGGSLICFHSSLVELIEDSNGWPSFLHLHCKYGHGAADGESDSRLQEILEEVCKAESAQRILASTFQDEQQQLELSLLRDEQSSLSAVIPLLAQDVLPEHPAR